MGNQGLDVTGGRWLIALAGLGGLAGVAFGAFGAHGTADPLARELFRTGASWETTQSLAALVALALAAAGLRWARLAAALFLVGIVLFSGSLYALGLGAPRLVGVATPLGGLFFIAGWIVLGIGALAGRTGAGHKASP